MTITWDELREAVNEHAANHGEWAGAPLPLHGLRLTVEPRYPWPDLNGFGLGVEEKKPEEGDFTLRNCFYCQRRLCEVYIWQEADGRVTKTLYPAGYAGQRLTFAVNTLGASGAWTAAAEIKALAKLSELIGDGKFDQYFLTGSFLETSKRSQVTYLFRKLRPTVALRPKDGVMKPLCALCLHPIGYYQESFAGCLCPTDDVIAHLLLMRADEHGYWKKANQHATWRQESGI